MEHGRPKVESDLNEDRRKESMNDQTEKDRPILFGTKGWRSLNWIILTLGGISAVLILFIMMVTVVDVVLRYIFKAPLKGSYEFCEIFFLSSVFLGLAYTQSFRGHVNVDILISRLSARTNLILEICMFLIALSIGGLLIWQGTEAFLRSLSTGEYRWGLIQIPLWPARLMIPVGVCALCLKMIGELLTDFGELLNRKKGRP
jgi:TRAP-type mannitol/chloroaromatic compound transport system permease small subunit